MDSTETEKNSKPERPLRSGYTTGACAAAAAKGALLQLLGKRVTTVDIPFPDESRHSFELCRVLAVVDPPHFDPPVPQALASVVKDAGDDPDVTNGAEIGAKVRPLSEQEGFNREENTDMSENTIRITNGAGVGRVSKPGLPIPVGEPAINPVPREMIIQAIEEGFQEAGEKPFPVLVSVFIRDGEVLAEKTLNHRLGIIGGLSVLGTTGIVRPVSAKAWTDTIEASMAVARAAGVQEVILSTGRTSEAAVQSCLQLPEEALVMMGDYLHYALEAAQRHGFHHIHLAVMWAKLVKAALAIPQTHVRHGALSPAQGAELLGELGLDVNAVQELSTANTAMEIYHRLHAAGRHDLIEKVCHQAQEQTCHWAGMPVSIYLVTSAKEIVVHLPGKTST